MNTKIKAIIVDDELGCIENLRYCLNKYCPDIDIVATASTIRDAADIILVKKFDVAFLDIQMLNDNIFNVMDNIDITDFGVVFVTAYDNFAVRAFRVNAIDYILKPIAEEEIKACYEKIKMRVRLKNTHNGTGNHINAQEKIHIFKKGERLFSVMESDIFYLKAKGFYTEVYFEHNHHTTSVLVSKPISAIEKEYSTVTFFRTHRSYLVNTLKIVNVIKTDKLQVKLANSHVLPVARTRLNGLLSCANHTI